MSSQKFAKYAAATAVGLLLSATATLAGPTYTFSVSEGTQPSNVGVVTLTQVLSGGCGGAVTACVDVLVHLADTTLPLPEYGFINTGGPHTPFAFTLDGSETGVTATFIQPAGGLYSFGLFSLSTNNGGDTPYGTFGISINSTAGNGTSNAYFGDLEFQVTRPGGLSTDDFITNSLLSPGENVYFAADLTDGSSNTGSQAWLTRDDLNCTSCGHTAVPEPGTLTLLGGALIGLGFVAFLRRRRDDECNASA